MHQIASFILYMEVLDFCYSNWRWNKVLPGYVAVIYRRLEEKGQKGINNLSFSIDLVYFYKGLFIQYSTRV